MSYWPGNSKATSFLMAWGEVWLVVRRLRRIVEVSYYANRFTVLSIPFRA